MNRPGLTRYFVSSFSAAALCFAPVACKSDDKAKEGAAADAKPATENAKGKGDAPEDPAVVAEGGGGADAPVVDAAMSNPDPTESAKLEYGVDVLPLLDMLPEGSDEFALIRDVNGAVDIYDTLVGSHLDSMKPLLGSAEMTAGLDEASKRLKTLRSELAKNVIDVDKGMMFAVKEEALIYSAKDPNAFQNLMKAMGAEGDEGPKHCVAPKGLPGYVACGDDKTVLEGLEAGKNGRAHLDKIEGALPDVDIDRANIIASLMVDGNHLAFTTTIASGALHATLATAGATAEMGEYLAEAPAPALGILEAGSAFVWASVGMKNFEKELGLAPPPFGTVGKTLTGELFFGSLAGTGGLGMMVGVNDPYPASGLVALAGTQLATLPKALDDGTTLEVKVEQIKNGEKDVSALHAVFGASDTIKKLVELGLKPEAFAFSAGEYVAVTVGADQSVVATVSNYKGKPPTAAVTGQLPGGLAEALAAGKVAYAVYLPMDAVQTESVREYFTAVMKAAPADQLQGMNPDTLAKSMVGAVGPFSSLSTWLTHPKKERVMHFVVQGFGDVATEEGRAANDAVIAVAGGADAKTTYAELAKKFPSSPAAPRYRARAGETAGSAGSAMTSAFVLGLVAGVTVPAFTRYMERSKEAAGTVEAPPQPPVTP